MNKGFKKVVILLLALMVALSAVACKKGKTDGGGTENPPSDTGSGYSVSLDRSEISMVLGDKDELVARYSGKNATLQWSSSDQTVVAVVDGKIEALKIGSAVITAAYGTAAASCTVQVSLGNLLPELKFSTNDDEIVLTKKQSFTIASNLTFNGRQYSDYQIECVGEQTVADYAVSGKNIVVTPKVLGEQTLTVKASWNGLDSTTALLLAKTVKIKVIDDFNFSLNGSGIKDIVLYTIDGSFDGKQYYKETPFVLEAYKDGDKIDGANIQVQIMDPTVVTREDNKLTAQKYGKTSAKISYEDTELNKTYTAQFNITVVRPVAQYPTVFRAFSVMDGKYKDIDGDFSEKSIITTVFGDDANKVVQEDATMDDETALSIVEDTIVGVTANVDTPAEHTLFLATAEYGYEIKVIAYTKYLVDADDITELFGAANAGNCLTGYYVLGRNIDASSATVSGGLRNGATKTDHYGDDLNLKTSVFAGTFDGQGYTISNLDVSGSSSKTGSLFGTMEALNSNTKETVKNVAFVNVKATYAAVISHSLIYYAIPATISDVYVSVSANTANFKGMVGAASMHCKNVVVEYLGSTDTDCQGVIAPSGALYTAADVYVISELPAGSFTNGDRTNPQPVTIPVYADYDAMKAASLNLSTFKNYWTTSEGVPAWINHNYIMLSATKNGAKVSGRYVLNNTDDELEFNFKNLSGTISGISITCSSDDLIIDGNKVKLKNPITSVSKEYTLTISLNNQAYGDYSVQVKIYAEAETIIDTIYREFIVDDKTFEKSFDISDLSLETNDIISIEIGGGKKYDLSGGVYPDMKLEARNGSGLYLKIAEDDFMFISAAATAGTKSFNPVTVKLYTNSGIYELRNVQFYNKVLKTPQDLTDLFGTQSVLNGYYALGNDINAETAQLSGTKRDAILASRFGGLFDGEGRTIFNLDISGTADKVGSLLGLLEAYDANSTVANALYNTVKNVAFVNVKATNAAVIAHANTVYYTRPTLSNIYVSVSTDTTNFQGIVSNIGGAICRNVVIEYLNNEDTNCQGVFAASGTLNSGSNNYVISPLPAGTAGTKYGSYEEMKNAVTDLSTFKTFWTTTSGVPVWNNYIPLSVTKNDAPLLSKYVINSVGETLKFSSSNANVTISITEDSSSVFNINGGEVSLKEPFSEDAQYALTLTVSASGYSYSLKITVYVEKAKTIINKSIEFTVDNKTLLLTDTGIDMSDVTSIEIGGTEYAVTDGTLPDMDLEARATGLFLKVADGAYGLITTKSADAKDFNPIKIILHTESVDYELTQVQIYSMVIRTAADLTNLFGVGKAAADLKHLAGYYVLGQNINEGRIAFSDGYRASKRLTNNVLGDGTTYIFAAFVGIFDGMGYTINNLSITGYTNNPGSLFGNMLAPSSSYKPTVRNVAFTNVAVYYAAVVSGYADNSYAGYSVPSSEISNVYISVTSTSTNFLGVVNSPRHITMNNVVVEFDKEESVAKQGSFLANTYNIAIDSARLYFSNNYVISDTMIFSTDASTEFSSSGVTRKSSWSEITIDDTALNLFNDCWNVSTGKPVWNNL